MNKPLSTLLSISQKKERRVLGLMSGTSLDGLDIVACSVSGSGTGVRIKEQAFETFIYPKYLQQALQLCVSEDYPSMRSLCFIHTSMADFYVKSIFDFLKKNKLKPESVDLIGSHGQTIYHAPALRLNEESPPVHATLQLVDGDIIAAKTGITTISDFRQKHISRGGEGAPLAGYFDENLFRTEDIHRVLVNIGGIANASSLPPKNSKNPVLSTDCGPGNVLIDAATRHWFNLPYDAGGSIALRGKVIEGLFEELHSHPFFGMQFPKSTGREAFSFTKIVEPVLLHHQPAEPEDIVATLSALTVEGISAAIHSMVLDFPFEVYVSGGGAHNRFILKELESRLPNAKLKKMSALGFSEDSKEAVMMAYFANEWLCGNGFSVFGKNTLFGKLSTPF